MFLFFSFLGANNIFRNSFTVKSGKFGFINHQNSGNQLNKIVRHFHTDDNSPYKYWEFEQESNIKLTEKYWETKLHADSTTIKEGDMLNNQQLNNIDSMPGADDSKDPFSNKQICDTQLTHVDSTGKAKMVDVGGKADTNRVAMAIGTIILGKEAFDLLKENKIKKGDVLTVANIAGIMGAKRTCDFIPLCHNIPLSNVTLDFLLVEYLPLPEHLVKLVLRWRLSWLLPWQLLLYMICVKLLPSPWL